MSMVCIITSHPGQLSLTISPWVGAMSSRMEKVTGSVEMLVNVLEICGKWFWRQMSFQLTRQMSHRSVNLLCYNMSSCDLLPFVNFALSEYQSPLLFSLAPSSIFVLIMHSVIVIDADDAAERNN